MKTSNQPGSQDVVDAPSKAVPGSPAASASSAEALEETAVALLLRSPRLSISTIMDLMDLGDSQLRAMAQRNERISKLLDARRDGQLPQVAEKDLIPCAGCGELFVPYANRSVCSDTCEHIRRVSEHKRHHLHSRGHKS